MALDQVQTSRMPSVGGHNTILVHCELPEAQLCLFAVLLGTRTELSMLKVLNRCSLNQWVDRHANHPPPPSVILYHPVTHCFISSIQHLKSQKPQMLKRTKKSLALELHYLDSNLDTIV